MEKYTSQRPIHPGELLKEEIEYRGLTQSTVASRLEISYKVLNEVLNGRRPLTSPMALLFEAAFGISAPLLMRMQLDYTMRQTASDSSFAERLKKVRQYAAAL